MRWCLNELGLEPISDTMCIACLSKYSATGHHTSLLVLYCISLKVLVQQPFAGRQTFSIKTVNNLYIPMLPMMTDLDGHAVSL
jgi:hypothetical protein